MARGHIFHRTTVTIGGTTGNLCIVLFKTDDRFLIGNSDAVMWCAVWMKNASTELYWHPGQQDADQIMTVARILWGFYRTASSTSPAGTALSLLGLFSSAEQFSSHMKDQKRYPYRGYYDGRGNLVFRASQPLDKQYFEECYNCESDF